ncbi:hypothetical protein CYMTET_34668, partial [Cymbomonas tetramitiformis]
VGADRVQSTAREGCRYKVGADRVQSTAREGCRYKAELKKEEGQETEEEKLRHVMRVRGMLMRDEGMLDLLRVEGTLVWGLATKTFEGGGHKRGNGTSGDANTSDNSTDYSSDYPTEDSTEYSNGGPESVQECKDDLNYRATLNSVVVDCEGAVAMLASIGVTNCSIAVEGLEGHDYMTYDEEEMSQLADSCVLTCGLCESAARRARTGHPTQSEDGLQG